jgi:hypothetical protein
MHNFPFNHSFSKLMLVLKLGFLRREEPHSFVSCRTSARSLQEVQKTSGPRNYRKEDPSTSLTQSQEKKLCQ